MKKNFKYILIFIFIICLLIPISCINIFALNSVNYLSIFAINNTINSSIKYEITFYNCSSINVNNGTEHTGNEIKITVFSNVSNNLKMCGIFIYNDGNIWHNSAQNYSQSKNVYITCDNTSYFIINYIGDNNYYINNKSGYGTQFSLNTNYYIKDFYNSDIYSYFECKNYNTIEMYLYYNYTSSTISFDKTYNLSFYNNDILYDSITISGASANGYAPFDEISQIKYGNTIVYDNSTWSSGYNSTLRYNQNMTMPDIAQLNIDCDSIVTFYVQLYYVYSEYSQTYNIGTFYNKSQEFNSIQVNGLTIGDNKFSSIDTIYYNEIKVYENNDFINSFDEDLYYMYNDINITDINTACNNIVIFTKTHIQPTTDDDILYGVGNILSIIKDFANMLLLNKVTIYCCVAIPLLSFAVFIVVKLKNGNDGDNKIN